MLFLKYLIAAVIIVVFPVALVCAGIPGLEGLKEMSDDDLEEICGNITPDDGPQLVLSRQTIEDCSGHKRTVVRGAFVRPGAAVSGQRLGLPDGNSGGVNMSDLAGKMTGGMVNADVDTSGLAETVTMRSDLADMLTPGNLLGSSNALNSALTSFDYAASGIVKISNPTIGGVGMKSMGDIKASMGVNISASITITP